jgi:hypothetical protein
MNAQVEDVDILGWDKLPERLNFPQSAMVRGALP